MVVWCVKQYVLDVEKAGGQLVTKSHCLHRVPLRFENVGQFEPDTLKFEFQDGMQCQIVGLNDTHHKAARLHSSWRLTKTLPSEHPTLPFSPTHHRNQPLTSHPSDPHQSAAPPSAPQYSDPPGEKHPPA